MTVVVYNVIAVTSVKPILREGRGEREDKGEHYSTQYVVPVQQYTWAVYSTDSEYREQCR